MFERLFKVIQAAFNNSLGKVEDPAIMLEQTYQDLQIEVKQLRDEVRQATAIEKRLEQTLFENKNQVTTDLGLKQHREATGKLRQRITVLENELIKAQTKKQMLIAADKAAKATMKANDILSKTSSSGALKVIDRMERNIQGLTPGDQSPDGEEYLDREGMTILAAQLGFALVLLVLNISFLYVLFYFAHLTQVQTIFVIPVALFFLRWIWLRENQWFFHRAAILWHEMSADLRRIKSSRKD